MTFTEMAAEIAERVGMSSPEAFSRIGRSINRVNKNVTTAIGMVTTRRDDPITVNTTISNRYVTFTCEKVLAVFRLEDSQPYYLTEISYDEMRRKTVASGDTPQEFAIAKQSGTTVTILLDYTPATAYAIYADAEEAATTLSGSGVPPFAESFHDVIIEKVVAGELERAKDFAGSDRAEQRYEKRLSDLKYHTNVSNSLKLRQNDSDVPQWMRRRG